MFFPEKHEIILKMSIFKTCILKLIENYSINTPLTLESSKPPLLYLRKKETNRENRKEVFWLKMLRSRCAILNIQPRNLTQIKDS